MFNLRLNKWNLSRAIRRRTSASDNRLSSRTMGGIGAAILCVAVLVIMLADAGLIRRHFELFERNISCCAKIINQIRRE